MAVLELEPALFLSILVYNVRFVILPYIHIYIHLSVFDVHTCVSLCICICLCIREFMYVRMHA